MGDEDNSQEERLDSVCEILSGATEEASAACLKGVIVSIRS